MKKVLGWVIIIWTVSNLVAVIATILFVGDLFSILLSLIAPVFWYFLCFDGATNWIHGKPWNATHKKLQEELAKTRKWE